MTPAEHSHAQLRDALILARRQLLTGAPELARPGPVLYKPPAPMPVGHGYRWTIATGVAAAVMILIGAVEFGGASSRPPVPPPAPQVAQVLQRPKPPAFAEVPQPAPAPDPPLVTAVKQEPEPEARPAPHKKRHHSPAKAVAKRTPHKPKPTKKRSSPY